MAKKKHDKIGTGEKVEKSGEKVPTSQGNGSEPNQAYKVGYRHPPLETRFKPGQSGNPIGKNQYSDYSLIEAHRQELNEQIPDVMKRKVGALIFGSDKTIPAEWLAQPLTWKQIIPKRNLFKAMSMQGDAIIKIVWEMLEGRPVTRLEGPGGGPIQLQNVPLDLKKLTDDELIRWREGTMTFAEMRQIEARIGGGEDESS